MAECRSLGRWVDCFMPRIYAERAPNFIDRTGQKHGRLTILKLVKKPGDRKRTFWLCRCDCGTEKLVDGAHLWKGHTQSCGCLRKEIVSRVKTTHGKTESKEYEVWCGIKSRCYNKRMGNYYLYGGRGIAVCKRWLHSFENFLSDMGIRPAEMTIERIDRNGNYEPSNCKWADRFEQANNKRNNVPITFNEVTMNIFQWSRKLKIPPKRLSARLISGWTVQRAFTERHHTWPALNA